LFASLFLLNDDFVFDQRPSLGGLGAEFWPAGGPKSSGRHIGHVGFVDHRINLFHIPKYLFENGFQQADAGGKNPST
jgi:hypothetical protein